MCRYAAGVDAVKFISSHVHTTCFYPTKACCCIFSLTKVTKCRDGYHLSYLGGYTRSPALSKTFANGSSGLPRAPVHPPSAASLGHIAVTSTSGVVLVVKDNSTKFREDVPRPLVEPEGHGERRGEGMGVHSGLKCTFKMMFKSIGTFFYSNR